MTMKCRAFRRLGGGMARQRLGAKKMAKLKAETGLPIVAVLVRGGTGHRRDLCLEDGSVVHLYRDGSKEVSQFRHAGVGRRE
jgi:hypothetical protein